MLFKQTRGFIMSEEKPTTSAPCAHDDHDPSECPSGDLQDTISSRDANDHDSAASATSSSSEGTLSGWEVVTSSEEGSPVIPKIEPPSPSSNEKELPTPASDAPNVDSTGHISTAETSVDSGKPCTVYGETELPTLVDDALDVDAAAHISTLDVSLDSQKPNAEGEAHISTDLSDVDPIDALKPSTEGVAHSAATSIEEEGPTGIVGGPNSAEISATATPLNHAAANTPQTAATEDCSSSPGLNEEENTPAPIEAVSRAINIATSNSQSDVPISEVAPPVTTPESVEAAPSDSATNAAATDSVLVDVKVDVLPLQEGSNAEVAGKSTTDIVPLPAAGVAPGAEASSVAPTTQTEVAAVALAPDATQVASSDSTSSPQVPERGDNTQVPSDASNAAANSAVAPVTDAAALADTSGSVASDPTPKAGPAAAENAVSGVVIAPITSDGSPARPIDSAPSDVPATTAAENVVVGGDVPNPPSPQVSVGDSKPTPEANKPTPEASNDTSNTATGRAVAPSANDAAPAAHAESVSLDVALSAQPSVVDAGSNSTSGTTVAENVGAGSDVPNASTPQVSEDDIKRTAETPSDASNTATGGAVASIANDAAPAATPEPAPSDTSPPATQPSVGDASSNSILATTAAENAAAGDAVDAPSTDPTSDSTPQATESPGEDASAPVAAPGAALTTATTVDVASADAKAAEDDGNSDTPNAESSAEAPDDAAAETPSEPSSPPPPPPPILPPGTTRRILLPYTRNETQPNTPAASGVVIPESILEEISATIAYSLSPTAQEKAWKATKDRLDNADDLERIHEPMVHLCYPYAHCHDVVDEAVRVIAKGQKADLVTIDVLDLAQMEYGPLGEKTAEAVKQLYSGKYYKDGVDESVQNVFDALVQVQPEDATADSSSAGTQRRIIYIKDFGTTILFSNRLLCRVLRAIHKRRSNATAAGTLLLPTVLVLGYVKSFNINSDTLEAFAEGGNNLRTLLDRPADKLCSVPWGYKPFPGPLTNFCTTYFLKSVLPKKDQNNLSSSSISNREDFEIDHYQLYAGAYLSVFPQGDVDKEKNREAESRMAERRQCDVFDAWMRVCLAHRGAEGPGYSVRYLGSVGASEDGESEGDVDYALVAKNVDGLAKKLGCVNLSAIDRVVITAIGLASTPEEEVVPGKELQEDAAVQETPALLDVTPIPGQEDAPVKEVQEDEPDVTPTPDEVVAPEREVQDDAAAQEEVPTLEATPTPDEEGTPAEEVAQKVTPVKVAASHILKAYALVLGGLDVREKWYKEKHPEVEKSDEKDSDDDEEPEEKAIDVVAKVKAASDLTEHEKQLLGSIVDTGRLASSFDDISVPECVIETLRTIITLPLLFPEAFSTGLLQREAMSGVLLYGPPGTGKTLLCRIAARECGARMLLIKPSDIMNKWVGESEKLVNAIFSLANRLAPCIVFIDEVDSCFRARSCDDKKWTRDMMSEFLQAMDGLVSSRKEEGGVLVIGATNRPYDIDDAIIRRLPSRMLIGSPGVTEREAILKIHLKGEALDSETDLSNIARMTVDYSGSDLKNLCVSAAMASLKEAVGKIDWSHVSSLSKKQTKKNEPANDQSKEPKGEEPESGVDAAKEKVKTRTVKMAHFKQAMKEVAPSSSVGSHRELYRWHERFGSMSR